MSITAQFFQSQVQILSGNDQIASKVLTWVSRACQEIAMKALWKQQTRSVNVGGLGAVTTVVSQWASLTPAAASNFVQMIHVKYNSGGSVYPLYRLEPQDLYSNFQGVTGTYSADTVEAYCIPRWTTSGNATSQYMAPYMAVYPVGTTAVTAYTAHFHSAPDKVATANDTNWIMSKYPGVVLNRVMALASLYLKDSQGYLLYMSKYANGVKDMVLTEETNVAATPYRRGIVPEVVMRGGV